MNISGFSYLPTAYQGPASARAESPARPVPDATQLPTTSLPSSASDELQSSLQRVNPGTSAAELNGDETEQEREEQRVTEELAQRDREVRQHEMAHKMAAGSYAGVIRYEYERGPDGQLYAVGGEVSIDTSPVPDDPEATLEKAEIVLRAALAPADPSPQDLRVAANARAMAAEARAEILRRETEAREQEAVEREETRAEEEADTLSPAASYEALRESRAAVLSNMDEMNSSRSDRLQEMRARREATAEELRAFAEQLAQTREALRALNNRLVETGVANRLYPPGSLLDRQA